MKDMYKLDVFKNLIEQFCDENGLKINEVAEKVAYNSNYNDNEVIRVNRSPGTKIYKGTTVTVYYAQKQAKPVESPSPSKEPSEDTDKTKETSHVECDVAFLPVGGTYTMDYIEAASLTRKIKPKYVIPTHYGSVVGDIECGILFKELINEKETKCELYI